MARHEWINLIGRVLVAFYFLWSMVFNIKNWDFNLAEFKRIGVAGGSVLLPASVVLMAAGSVLLVYSNTVIFGAALLIIFTWTADALFHRYWTYTDPQEQTAHKQLLFEHVALIGGIIGLAGSHI